MEYFPFYVEIGKMRGIVIGGGKIALQKVKVLSQFDFALTILAPDLIGDLYEIQNQCNQDSNRKHRIRLLQKYFEDDDIIPFDFVVAASNDHIVNKKLSVLALEYKKLINVVDDRECCNFIFPSIVKQKDLVIGISTGGVIPYLSKKMKEQVQETLPGYYGELLELLGDKRQEIKEMIPDMRERSLFYEEILQFCSNHNRSMTLEEWMYYKGASYGNNTNRD